MPLDSSHEMLSTPKPLNNGYVYVVVLILFSRGSGSTVKPSNHLIAAMFMIIPLVVVVRQQNRLDIGSGALAQASLSVTLREALSGRRLGTRDGDGWRPRLDMSWESLTPVKTTPTPKKNGKDPI